MSVNRDLEPGQYPCNFKMTTKSQIKRQNFFGRLYKKKLAGGDGGFHYSSTPVPFEATMHEFLSTLLNGEGITTTTTAIYFL